MLPGSDTHTHSHTYTYTTHHAATHTAQVTASVAYAFFTVESAGGRAWRIHALTLYPFVYASVTGNLRVLCKWYPWTRYAETVVCVCVCLSV